MDWRRGAPAAAHIAVVIVAVVAAFAVRHDLASHDVTASPPALGAAAEATTSTVAPAATTTAPVPPATTAPVAAAPAPPPPPPAPPKPWKLMLIGDSMAFTAGLGLGPHAPAWEFALANEGINGCGVVRGGPYRYFGQQHDMLTRCEAWPAAWQDAIARNQPHMVAIVVGRWELMDRVHNGQWTNLFDPTFAAYVESELDAAVTIAGSGGAKVVLFTTPYYRRGTAPGGGLFPEDDPARVDVMNGIIRAVAARRQVAVVDVGGWLSPEGHYTRDVAGVRVRSDGVHLTRQTGDLLAPWLYPQLQQVMTAPAPVAPAQGAPGAPSAPPAPALG